LGEILPSFSKTRLLGRILGDILPSFRKNRVLGRIFKPKRDELTGGRIKLYSEQLTDRYG
jgi:hypothetical protein